METLAGLTLNEADLGAADNVTDKERPTLWELLSSLNSMTASPPTYAASWAPLWLDPFKPYFPGACFEKALKTRQVQFFARAEVEEQAVPEFLLVDEMGLPKDFIPQPHSSGYVKICKPRRKRSYDRFAEPMVSRTMFLDYKKLLS